MRTALLAIALAFVAPHAQAAPACTVHGLPKIVGLSYHQARAVLIEAGFKPVMQPMENIEDRGVELAEPKSLGYFEVGSCAGTGTAPCVADWKPRKGRAFIVQTQGHMSEVAGIDCAH